MGFGDSFGLYKFLLALPKAPARVGAPGVVLEVELVLELLLDAQTGVQLGAPVLGVLALADDADLVDESQLVLHQQPVLEDLVLFLT